MADWIWTKSQCGRFLLAATLLLSANWITRHSWLAISHGFTDHYGGIVDASPDLVFVVQACPPDCWSDGGITLYYLSGGSDFCYLYVESQHDSVFFDLGAT